MTHEQDEAFDLGDRVAVLRGGRLEQVGTPDELYGAPANAFVAAFIGRSSTAEVTVIGPSERGARGSRSMAVEWDVDAVAGSGRAAAGPGDHAGAARGASPHGSTSRARSPATIIARRFVGAVGDLHGADRRRRRARGGRPAAGGAAPGARVGLMPSRRVGGGIHLFPPRDGR